MSGPVTGRLTGLLAALLAAGTAWAAAWSWAPLYSAPHRYLVPALAIAVLVAVVGTAGRALRLPPYVVPVVQVAVAVLVLGAHFADLRGQSWFDPGAIPDLFRSGAAGSRDLNTYTAPVPGRFVMIAPFLAGCALALAVAVDLFACGLRRVPLAGLPILLALTVPISVLSGGLSVWVFLATGALYVALLAVQHTRQLHGWGRDAADPAGPGRRSTGVSLVAGRIGSLALAGAVVVPIVVPVTHGIFNGNSDDQAGNGNKGVTLVNPMIDIRRDLIRKTHTPMVDAHTDDVDPSYVQLTVLDEFTGSEWRASNRHLPEINRAGGAMPTAPGVGPTLGGQDTNWQISLADTFDTSWLPVPAPTTRLSVPGDWRYDSRTLDVVNTGKITDSEGLRYKAQGFHPSYDANVLNAAGTPVGQAVEGMTALPSKIPDVIRRVARRVTRTASTEYQQAIALQDWFRDKGGFTYSTRPAPGSGMALIASFITHDKVGYCEQFAAAMAVMGRTLGIPTRVVVGFLGPTGVTTGADHYLYTSDDLHAWPELYFGGAGWVPFEPTPGTRTGAAPAYTRQRLQPAHVDRPSPTAQPNRSPTDKPKVPLPEQSGGSGGSSLVATVAWLLGLLVLVGLAGLPRVLRIRQRRDRLSATTDARTLAAGAWAELRATALDHRLGWAERRTPRQALSMLRSRVTADPVLVDELRWLTGFIERARYARPSTLDEAEARRVRRTVEDWSAEIRRVVSPRTARRARWWPASLLDRGPAQPVIEERQADLAAKV